MLKLWVQIITDNKIQKNFIYSSDKSYDRDEFFYHLVEIASVLEIATPILTKSHFYNFEEFNNMRFIQRDFIEQIDFDRLLIENVPA